MEVIFNDGTSETFKKADKDQSSIEEGIYIIRDKDDEMIAEITIHSIKIIRWD